MSQVAVITRDASREGAIAGVKVHDQMGNRAKEGAAAGAFTGGVLGSVAGLLVGLGSISIPILTPVLAPALVTGELAALGTAVVGAIAGAATGGLLGTLIGLGIPADRARRYRDRVARGDYLVMLSGTEREIQRAEDVLQRGGIQDWGVYGHSGATATAVRSAPVVASVEAPRHTFASPTQRSIVSPSQAQAARPVSAPTGRNQALPLSSEKRAIGVFGDRQAMETALDALRASGFAMHKLSFVMRDMEHVSQFRDAARGVNPHAQAAPSAGALGSVTGLLVGLNRVTVPGMGSVLVAGAEASVLTAALDGGMLSAIGGGLKGALVSLGIPQERARGYQDQVGNGASLVLVRATGEEVLHAASVLNRRGMQDWGIYDVSDTVSGSSSV